MSPPLALEQYYNTLRMMAGQTGEKTAALLGAAQNSPSTGGCVSAPSSHSKTAGGGRKSPTTPDASIISNSSSIIKQRDKRSDRCDYCGKVRQFLKRDVKI